MPVELSAGVRITGFDGALLIAASWMIFTLFRNVPAYSIFIIQLFWVLRDLFSFTEIFTSPLPLLAVCSIDLIHVGSVCTFTFHIVFDVTDIDFVPASGPKMAEFSERTSDGSGSSLLHEMDVRHTIMKAADTAIKFFMFSVQLNHTLIVDS